MMIGSVSKLIQQNALPQGNLEKKGNSTSENRSEFEKSLEESTKKSNPASLKQDNKKSVVEPQQQEPVQVEASEADQSVQQSSVESDNFQNPGKLTPGEKIGSPSQFKESAPTKSFFAESPYKSEVKSTQSQETANDEGYDELTKKLAMQTFMKRMKDELGVEPSRVMKAFSSLSMEELTRPPEENVSKIIQSLGLDPQQQMIAKQLFDDMLKQTASQSMASYLKDSGRDLSLNVMTAKEIKQQELARGLDDMSSKFFVKNQQAPKLQEQSNDSTMLMGSPFAATPVTPTAPTTSAAPAPVNVQAMPPSLMNEMQPVSAFEGQQLQAQLKELLAQNPQAQQAAPKAMDLSTSSFALNSSKVAPTAEGIMPMSMLGADDFENSEETMMNDDGSSDLQGLIANQHQPTAPLDQKNISFAGNMDIQSMQQADSANVKELINQAQFLARRGGGEMKIKLNPEGLGEVNMTVALHEGQLNVQMVTDSNEAKKLIERGLGELKATLSAHQLNVDQIKVDSTQTSLEKQMAQNQEDAQRNSARQFMEQFRQDSSGWKRNFYDINPARSYRSQREEASQPSIPVQAMSDRSKASSRRLNLVA